jgi:ABC-type Fe3+-hydroxamate transport system substrate-binding protein
VSALACGTDTRSAPAARAPTDSANGAASAPSLDSGTAVAVDDFGDSIRVRDSRRIVSLNPTTTELLFAIGAGDRVVGRSKWDQWPDSARLVPAVGDGIRPNIESVLAMHPDLVVLYASADNRSAVQSFRAAGIATLALRVDRIDEFRRATHLLGAAIGDTVRARTVRDSVDRTLDRVRVATASLPRPTVFWKVWDEPVITIGRGSFMSELVEIAGGRNVYDDAPAPSPQVAFEDVIRRNPDVVLAGPISAQRMKTDARWSALGAVRRGRLVTFDTTLVGRPSVKLGEAAVSLARLLHPGALR